jgi:hypothetical protein
VLHLPEIIKKLEIPTILYPHRNSVAYNEIANMIKQDYPDVRKIIRLIDCF